VRPLRLQIARPRIGGEEFFVGFHFVHFREKYTGLGESGPAQDSVGIGSGRSQDRIRIILFWPGSCSRRVEVREDEEAEGTQAANAPAGLAPPTRWGWGGEPQSQRSPFEQKTNLRGCRRSAFLVPCHFLY